MAIGIGTCVAHYRLASLLGFGSFSKVFRATDIETDQDVAIKLIMKCKSTAEMVKSEVVALERTRGHPHIVQLLEVYEDRAHVYIVTELCDGGTIHDYLVRHGAVAEHQAIQWFAQLLAALKHCHDRGVVHRDVKNANIFLTKINGQLSIKLGDFGLAVVTESSVHTTALCTAAGSAVFAAPEVYATKNGLGYFGPPADLWGAGVVLHALLVRGLPFAVDRYSQTWHDYKAPACASPSCRTLLRLVLSVCPVHRPGLGQLLKALVGPRSVANAAPGSAMHSATDAPSIKIAVPVAT